MMESTIHQLYCTHCTYGTSFLHQQGAATNKDQSCGYGVRAGSIPHRSSDEYFRRIDTYLETPLLPGDLPRDQVLKHDATTTAHWRRLVFLPSVAGMQVLAQVAFRTTDTQGRPGSYFAHVLMAERTAGESQWSATEALKLWGSTNWVTSESEGSAFVLPEQRSLKEFRKPGQRTIDDQVLLSFLTAASGCPFEDPGSVIPARWKQKSPTERRELLIDALQSFLELNFDKRQTLLLAIEPSLAALIFYGVARLLPSKGIGEKLSFSTFESHSQRPQTSLAATTFHNPETGELPRDQSSRGFAINTFRPDQSPALSWKSAGTEAERPQYARTLVDLFVRQDGGVKAVGDLLSGFEQAGAVQKDVLEELVRADDWAKAFLTGDSSAAAAKLKQLEEKESVKRYLRQSVVKQLARLVASSGPDIKAAPPPPPVNRALPIPPPPPGSGAAVATAGTTSEPASGVVLFRPDEAPAASVPVAAASPSVWQGSPEFRQIADNPARVLDIFKLIAVEEDSPDSLQVVSRLLDAFVANGPTQLEAFLRAKDIALKHKRAALKTIVDRERKLPTSCEWLWSEPIAASNSPPTLLTGLLSDLEDERAESVLSGLLETRPDKERVANVLAILGQVCETGAAKRRMLVRFVDHPQLPSDVLLDGLRSSQSVRLPVFKHYAAYRAEQPEGEFRLIGELEGICKNLTEAKEFRRSLDLLSDGKELLYDAQQSQLQGWRDVRKHLLVIKGLLEKQPNFVVKLVNGAHQAELDTAVEQLGKAAHRAMPDSKYDDPTGFTGLTHLKDVAKTVLASQEFPDSYRGSLKSVIASGVWQRSATGGDSQQSLKTAAMWLVPLVVVVIVGGVAASQFMGTSEPVKVAQVEPGGSKPAASTKPASVPPKVSKPPKQESPKPAPKPAVQVAPKPVKPEPEVVAVVTPVVPKPMPPEPSTVPVVPDKTPVVGGLVEAKFAVGPESRSIAYVPLPPYPQADASPSEIHFKLPGELPVKGRKLHGFSEHKSRLSDSDFAMKEDTQPESKRALDVVHACLGKDGATLLPLCTFEIQEQKVGVFRWHQNKSISPVQPLEEAVRCCVLEIERGSGPEESLFVSFLKPVVIEQPVEFDVDGLGHLQAADLRLVELSNPLSFGPLRLRVVRVREGKSEPFVFDRKELLRRPTASFDEMKTSFGFASATLQTPPPLSKRPEGVMSLELKVAKRAHLASEHNAKGELVNLIGSFNKALRNGRNSLSSGEGRWGVRT